MSEHLLSTTTKGVTHGIIAGLRESTVIPGIRHPSPEVRLRAVTCIGLFALLDTNAARTDGPLLVQIARNDQESVREVALKALMDITLLYGTKVWAAPGQEEGKPSELGTKVMDVIMDSLEEDSAPLKTVAAEGTKFRIPVIPYAHAYARLHSSRRRRKDAARRRREGR